MGKEGCHDLGFDISVEGKVTAGQAIMLNKAEEKLPSMSDVAKADDIELKKIMENTARSMENLTVQLEGESSEDSPMPELLGLDKQLRSIRGPLRVEVAKKVQLEEHIKKENVTLRKSETIQDTTMEFKKTLGTGLKGIMTN